VLGMGCSKPSTNGATHGTSHSTNALKPRKTCKSIAEALNFQFFFTQAWTSQTRRLEF